MKSRPWLRVAVASLVGQALLGSATVPWAASLSPSLGVDPCTLVSAGVDTSQATNYVAALDCEAPGQTFLAVDTLITSITVWRAPVEASIGWPMKLWITDVDSLGMPLTSHVVFDGPEISVVSTDFNHATKIQYSFEPPIALPRKGTYFFAIQERVGGFFDLLAVRDADPYPHGSAWRTARSWLNGCFLAPGADRLIANDLVFTIEFCKSTTTPVRSTTWGKLKVIYR